MSDSVVSLGGSEVIDLDTASPEALRAAAAKLRHMPVEHRFQMLERDSPPSVQPYSMDTLTAQRIDFDYEEDAQRARTARAMAEIQRALIEEEQQAKKTQADTRTQLRERAGALGALLARGFR